MHLREVRLRNWRSYRSAEFKFPEPKGSKKVVLVGAMNGHGKTSLLIALHLGLFGREAMPFLEGVKLGVNGDDRIRSYRLLMQQILHRPALEQEDPHASVQLMFRKDGDEILVTRTWHFTRGGQPRDLNSDEGEETRIEINGRIARVSGWEEANNRISTLLFPSHVMPCFFFDGEQAQERVEASGGRALSDAIHALFGTTLFRELDDSLRTYLTNQRSSVRRDVGDVRQDELDKKRARRDELQGEMKEIEGELKGVRGDLDATNRGRNEKMLELTQVSGDSSIDLAQLASKKADLKAQEQTQFERLTGDLAALALPIAFRKWARPAEDQLAAESVRDRWVLLKEETSSKVDGIISHALPPAESKEIEPPLSSTQRQQLDSRMRKALEALWIPPPDGCADEFRFHFLGASDRQSTLARLRAAQHTGFGDVAGVAAEWQATRTRLKDVERQWESISNVKPRIEKLKQEIDELNARSTELSERKSRLEQRERGIHSELKDLAGAIGQMEKLKRKLGPVEARIDVGERVRSVIAETKDRLLPLCKSSLAESCSRHLRGMISSEFARYSVNFDDELQPMLIGPKDDKIYISTLSGAQKRAFGLAFTLAVAEISGEGAPLVIDTPVGNMDSEYRKRILTYLSEEAPGQVIFLSHDEEISDEYAKAITKTVAARFLVTFEHVGDGAGVSVPVEGQYF